MKTADIDMGGGIEHISSMIAEIARRTLAEIKEAGVEQEVLEELVVNIITIVVNASTLEYAREPRALEYLNDMIKRLGKSIGVEIIGAVDRETVFN